MGKRKSSSKPQTGKKGPPPLDTVFECLFCQNSNSVSVKMDQKESIGLLRCKTCLQKFSCHITPLSAPIDVYTDWIDACEDANREEQRSAQRQRTPQGESDGEERPRTKSSKKRREAASDEEEEEEPEDDEDEDDEEDRRQKKRKTGGSSKKSSSSRRYEAEFSDEDDLN